LVEAAQPDASDHEIEGLIRESAEAFIAAEDTLGLARRRREAGDEDGKLWGAMAGLGWSGLLAPEAQGGGGLPLRAAAVLQEALGRGLAGGGLIASAHLPLMVALSGEGPLREGPAGEGPAAAAVVAALAAGETSYGLAFQGAAGALSADETPLRLEEAGAGPARLSGSAAFVVAEAGAPLLVAARGGAGVAVYRVSPGATGLKRKAQRTADGGELAQLLFDGVDVTPADLVVAAGAGTRAVDGALDRARILIAAELLGLAREAFARTLDYLKTRKQFGRLIGSFQALQHRAVDLYVQIELSAAALAQALDAEEAGADAAACAAAASAAKARAADAALLVTREAVQMHGAIGYTREHDIGLFLDRALTLAAALGNGAAHRRRYGLLLSRSLAA